MPLSKTSLRSSLEWLLSALLLTEAGIWMMLNPVGYRRDDGRWLVLAAAGQRRIGLKKPKQKPTLSDPEARGLIFASGLVEHGALLWRFKMPPHECPNFGASITFAAEERRLGLMGVFGIALVCLWLIG
jgi:hypothetical protein